MAAAPNDDAVARLLRRSLSADDGKPGEDCPDAEMLSAFAERTLSNEETREVENHLASCASCTRIVAMVIASEPEPAAALDAPRRWAWWRWAVPVATAATVAGLWVATRQPQVAEPPQSAMVAQPAPAPAPPTELKAEEPAVDAPRELQRQAAAPRELERRARAPRDAAANAEAPPAEVPPAAAAVTAPLPPAPTALSRSVGAPPPPAPPEQAAAAPQAFAQSATALRTLPAFTVSSPASSIAWRVRGPEIERSTDGGSTWSHEFTADRLVLAGSAVNGDVVWMVGAQGLVLRRTTAGWSAAPPPTGAALSRVEAASPTEAMVSTADGTGFHTVDGGATWAAR